MHAATHGTESHRHFGGFSPTDTRDVRRTVNVLERRMSRDDSRHDVECRFPTDVSHIDLNRKLVSRGNAIGNTALRLQLRLPDPTDDLRQTEYGDQQAEDAVNRDLERDRTNG